MVKRMSLEEYHQTLIFFLLLWRNCCGLSQWKQIMKVILIFKSNQIFLLAKRVEQDSRWEERYLNKIYMYKERWYITPRRQRSSRLSPNLLPLPYPSLGLNRTEYMMMLTSILIGKFWKQLKDKKYEKKKKRKKKKKRNTFQDFRCFNKQRVPFCLILVYIYKCQSETYTATNLA